MTQFFGYWGGALPPVTELHFRSFIYFHPNAKYHLWMDEDVGFSIPPPLDWLKDHSQIKIKPFSLSKLVDSYVENVNNNADSAIFNLMRFIHRKKILRHIPIKSYYSPLFKLNYKHSSPLFTYKKDLVYRGDLARCIIPVSSYNSSTLYSDLDVCLLSNLYEIWKDKGFVYQWEGYDFANSAILYSPNKNTATNILKVGNQIECFRPWYLFSNAICQSLGLTIYPVNQFDAMWDKQSLLSGDAMKFFKKSALAQEMVDELFRKKYIVNHWHNSWRVLPEVNSPYDLLLKKMSTIF